MIRLDGGLGTMLQAAGLPAGCDPVNWNLENPDAVGAVHRAYVEAGAEVILTNTFGANRVKYHGRYRVEDLVRAACAIARRQSPGKIALSVGPLGRLLKPCGDLDFETGYSAFAELVRCAAPYVDLVFIETISDLLELKAAVLAARENCEKPIYATVALDEGGKLLTGASVECIAALLESLPVEAFGFNCGLGPDLMLPFVKRLAEISSKPIIVKPNAGLPKIVDGRTLFDFTPDRFAACMADLVRAGAEIVGGCCGTTPDHIRAIAPLASAPRHAPIVRTVVTSGNEAIELRPHEGLIIGERINPTGKKRLKEAYASGDVAFVLREAVNQVEAGAAMLDVNCGLPGVDEAELLSSTVSAVQGVVTCPLQLDTASPRALAMALRQVNGRPLVNSVNATRESMDAVFPLVRRYGGVLVALCLDESGIPATSEGRLALARRILAEGAKYGFCKEDFVFDALTLAVSSDPNAARVTLESVRRLTDELGVNTVLGVSNVSFGLPNRQALNNAMYTLAKRAGLSAAIANPLTIGESDDAAAFDVLLGRDRNCERWIRLHAEAKVAPDAKSGAGGASLPSLRQAIIRGLGADAREAAARECAEGRTPLEIIKSGIVPALEEVGVGFEKGRLFLPQLLMAADAAKEAFEAVKGVFGGGERLSKSELPIVLATVKGDIHDIGKNIVRALLENYGFSVIDLGRDVPPEKVVEAARRNRAMLVGLSSLMTTTLGAMAETIRQIKAAGLDCRTCVGGAVVTQDYADSIGADFYAKDAMRTVRIAESLVGLAKTAE